MAFVPTCARLAACLTVTHGVCWSDMLSKCGVMVANPRRVTNQHAQLRQAPVHEHAAIKDTVAKGIGGLLACLALSSWSAHKGGRTIGWRVGWMVCREAAAGNPNFGRMGVRRHLRQSYDTLQLLRLLLSCEFFADRLMRGMSGRSLLESQAQCPHLIIALGTNLGVPRRCILRILSGYEHVRNAAAVVGGSVEIAMTVSHGPGAYHGQRRVMSGAPWSARCRVPQRIVESTVCPPAARLTRSYSRRSIGIGRDWK